jgi:chromate transporter
MKRTAIGSEPPGSANPSLLDLFLAFLGIALIGFGGVMPWARRMLVERRKWLTPTEFAEALALAQFLPGGNIVNLSVAVGQRYHGLAGSLVAVTGLIGGPFILVTTIGGLYLRYGETPVIHHVLSGVSAGAAGLMLCMAAQMARPLLSRGALVPLGFAVVAFVTVGLAKLPLIPVLAVLIPISVAVAWWNLP